MIESIDLSTISPDLAWAGCSSHDEGDVYMFHFATRAEAVAFAIAIDYADNPNDEVLDIERLGPEFGPKPWFVNVLNREE
jgi:hypothetical protein